MRRIGWGTRRLMGSRYVRIGEGRSKVKVLSDDGGSTGSYSDLHDFNSHATVSKS